MSASRRVALWEGTTPKPPGLWATMPRYYFDTDDGQHFIEGQESFHLYGLKEARLQAQAALADIARDHMPGGADQRTMTCRVRDDSGTIVLLASLVLMIQEYPEREKPSF